MKTRAGYVVQQFSYGIGWRILDETGDVDTRPNGVVELVSEPEHGSTFTVTLHKQRTG